MPPSLSPNLRGALFMALSMVGFAINDALLKLVLSTASQYQAMLVRGAFATVLIAIVAWGQGAFRFRRHVLHPMVGLRAFGELGSTLTFLAALQNMPLANVSAVLQALPLAVSMGAALFLGETVGWRRWLAIMIGFSGVLVIVRPGMEGFDSYALLALACVFFCTVRDIATRRIPDHVPTTLVSTVTSVAVTCAGLMLVLMFEGWQPLGATNWKLLAGAAILVVIGYQFSILGMRTGDISFVAPFRYTALLWSIVLGFLLFGDVPDTAMIIGASIVVASGLYTLYRERVVGKQMPASESAGPQMSPDGL